MTNNKRLTNEELTQIKERAEKATRGKWSFVPIDDSLEYFIVGEDGNEAVASEVFMINDAAFIAHAREDIPKLLAEIGALQEDNAQLRTKVRKARRLDEDFEDTYDFIYGGDNE